MLYLFAGVPRDGDIESHLKDLALQFDIHLHVRALDLKSDPGHDLTSKSLWEEIFRDISAGLWDVLILSPPCNTFSRARCNWMGNTFPKPVRDHSYPWGFPWNSNQNRQLAETHNLFIQNCLHAVELQTSLSRYWLWEHPEDLGRTKEGQFPASVWQLREMQQAIQGAKGVTWALYQCHYGASTPKPTRLATNLPGPLTEASEWPVFDDDGWYAGPLSSCGHYHNQPLQGLEGDQWRTGPSAAYPSAFCYYLAQLCLGAIITAPQLADTGAVGQVEHEAERYAMQELDTGKPVTRTAVSTLFSLLPKEPPHKAAGSLEGLVFVSGGFSKGGIVGLRQNCRLFPRSTLLVNKFIKEQAPHHCYAAFSILHNVKAEAHKDLGNAPTMNLLIGVSQFVNGGLWVEASDGTHKLTIKDQDVFGTVHAVCNSTVLFDARNSWHATMPWTGDRLVIAAYNPAFAENLPAQQHQQLRDLGFPLDLDPQDANVPSSSTLPSGLGDAGVDSEVLGAAGDDGDSAVHEEVQVLGSSEEDASEGKGEKFDPSFSRALGPPMQCHHEGYTKEFVDGFGLCSPGRWPPEARGHLQTLEERKHVASVMKILEDLVQDAIPDVKRKSMELALGRLESSPFTEEQLWRARERICDLLPAPETAREVPERQPFLLHMLGQSLKLLNDPDWEILCQGPESFAEGVPLGCNGELKRTPQVFRERVKSRKLDETDFQPIMQNYSSAELTQNQLEEKFKQDEALGRMIATTEAAARQEYPEVLVAALGAICKPNGDVRPLHDATHGVRINNRITVPDRLETPGPEEIVEMVTRAKATKQAAFCISADISAAHRCVKIKKSDWGRLGCKTCSSSQTLWINTVGTFGVSSASYHWSRLFGAIGRWALRIMAQRWTLQIIYVDDLHVVVVGPDRFKTLWLLLAAYEVAGTPFNYAKFKGGHEAEFVGYFLSYADHRAGISERRCRWVLDWIASVERDRWMVLGRNLAEFVGRMTFVGRLVGWVRPFLAPLYAWKAFLNRGTTARAPEAVYLSLCYLRDHFAVLSHTVRICQVKPYCQQAFRTDAKCEKGRIVLGGWSLMKGLDPKQAEWFALELRPSDCPWLFGADGESKQHSTSAELLASYVAVIVFGHLREEPNQVTFRVILDAGTDNKSAPQAQKKGHSTKWPLFGVLMQMVSELAKNNKLLRLAWRPREQNQEADDLTNLQFDKFDLRLRKMVGLADVPLAVVHDMSKVRQDFLDRCAELKPLKLAEGRASKKQKMADKTPW